MKKFFLTLFLTFFLVGCPSVDENYIITLHDFSIQASCLSDENCEDEFKVYLDFNTSEILVSNYLSKLGGIAYANHAQTQTSPGYTIDNEVVDFRVLNSEEFDDLPSNSIVNDYFEVIVDNSDWVGRLPTEVESINASIILQNNYDKGLTVTYFSLNKSLETSYSGSITVELELSDATILTSTVENVFIAAN